jgi:GDP-L-fucose synthase
MASRSESDLAGAVVAVTGADGFVGRYVVQALQAVGASVREVTGSDADLRVPNQAAAALAGAESVVHLAARAGGVQFQAQGDIDVLVDNSSITRNVLAAAAGEGVGRVFLASSAVVYSRHAKSPLAEDSLTVMPGREPVSAYAWSKLTDEVQGGWFANAASLEVVIGRFTNVYGSGSSFAPQRSTVVHALVKKAVDAGPDGSIEVWGDGTAVRSFVHARDCARAVLTILAKGSSGRAYNVSAPDAISIRDLAEQVRAAAAPRAALVFDSSRPSGPRERVLSIDELLALGYRPEVDLTSGIHEVVDHYRRVGRG